MALAKIARRDTLRTILPHVRDKKNETTWRVLGYITRSADEALYAKLTSPCEFRLPDGSLRDWIEGLADQCGLRIVLTNEVPVEFLSRKFQERQYKTSMQVVEYLLVGHLNYDDARFALYLANGVVNIGTIEDALAFWDRSLARP